MAIPLDPRAEVRAIGKFMATVKKYLTKSPTPDALFKYTTVNSKK